MKKCPNCGRATLRTADWVCQWCGYPLLSIFYKKLPKTYKQFKEEQLRKFESIQEPEPEPEPQSTYEHEAIPALESQKEPIPEPERKVESILEPERQIEAIREPELEPQPTYEHEALPALESQKESALEPERKVEPIQEPVSEPEPVAMELTVEELLSAYETEGFAADVKFANKLLRLTGVVAVVDVKEMLDTHYIRLTGAERDPVRSVRCMFDKKYALVLEKLEKGQTVTVQGIYNGSMMAIRMIDCVLVQ
jgi:DNA-directed RNA polymerase subunit RPC12/RpoP